MGQTMALALTEDLARGLLEEHVRTTRWLRRDIADSIKLQYFKNVSNYQISYMALTVVRSIEYRVIPYKGGGIDGPEHGPAPSPDTISTPRVELLTSQVLVDKIPHTSTLELCPECKGDGYRGMCPECAAINSNRITAGLGAMGQCTRCDGSGQLPCRTCNAAREVEMFQGVVHTFTALNATETIQSPDIPKDLLSIADGSDVLIEDPTQSSKMHPTSQVGNYRTQYRVNEQVDAVIDKLINSLAIPPNAKVHAQRMSVRAVPVYEGAYQWGSEIKRFWIVGNNQLVYAPNYPLSSLRIGGVVASVIAVCVLVLAFATGLV